MHDELRPRVVNLQLPADLDKIVAPERIHHFGDVVPHTGFYIAGSVGQTEREIGLARALLANLLRLNEKDRVGDLIRFQLANRG